MATAEITADATVDISCCCEVDSVVDLAISNKYLYSCSTVFAYVIARLIDISVYSILRLSTRVSQLKSRVIPRLMYFSIAFLAP